MHFLHTLVPFLVALAALEVHLVWRHEKDTSKTSLSAYSSIDGNLVAETCGSKLVDIDFSHVDDNGVGNFTSAMRLTVSIPRLVALAVQCAPRRSTQTLPWFGARALSGLLRSLSGMMLTRPVALTAKTRKERCGRFRSVDTAMRYTLEGIIGEQDGILPRLPVPLLLEMVSHRTAFP